MKRVRASLQRLGPAGVIAFGVLLCCGVFYWSTVRPLERALDSRVRTATLRQSTEPSRFYDQLPSFEQLPEELERLYRLARDADIEVARGEYRLENTDGPLVEYRVTLPLRGRYAQVRDFLGATLAAMPGAAIYSLRFTRGRASETRIEAQLGLTLYFRSPNMKAER